MGGGGGGGGEGGFRLFSTWNIVGNKEGFSRKCAYCVRLNFFCLDLVQISIAECDYICTRNVLWCQEHSSHIHDNHETLK